jgi:hypothetical protein
VDSLSVEANHESALRATQYLNSTVASGNSAIVIEGLSSDAAVVAQILKHYAEAPPEVIISELVGFLASSEGLVSILADVQQCIVNKLATGGAPIFIPSKYATVSTH